MHNLWDRILRSNKEEESLSTFLQRIPVFSHLNRKDFQYIKTLIHTRAYSPGEIIFEQGDPGSGMYIIRSGHVTLFTRDAHNKREDLSVLGPEDFFGETTIATPTARVISASCNEKCELLGLFRSDLFAVAERRPEIANRILLGLTSVISERLQNAILELRKYSVSEES
ncbi:MAG: cyclic nucleotide-binding domain-containing protein [Desulfuromonadaceae bacterium]|nr:cyclic nucleotide-binding domain-containing protein [Desulfuromonadaceae bacterium]